MAAQNFQLRLKEAMLRKNVKQIDVLRAAEVQNIKLGKSHMSQYVSGKSIPRDNILNFLAAFLEVSPQWLRGEDIPAPILKETGEIPMRKFNKSSKLDNVLYDVRGPVVEEAARMDGCNLFTMIIRIYLPLLVPCFIAHGLIAASYQWNNFLWPLITINSVNKRLLTVGLAIFAQQAEIGAQWTDTCAATFLTVAPLLIVFFFFQKRFIESFAHSGIK